jgi:predicted dehydrogenase
VSKIRIGFVGVGRMGQSAHLKNFVTVPGCEVVAIAEKQPRLAAAVARRYGIERVYSDVAQMFAAEALDGIVASQRFTKHGGLIPALLEKGVPVLTEKPIAGSTLAGEAILAASQRPGAGRLFIGYHKRSDPATLRVKQQMAQWQASGEVGKLRYVRIAMPPGDWIAGGFTDLISSDEPYPTMPDDAMPAGWDADRCKRYLAFVNYYIHQVNLLRHLLGEDYAASYVDPTGVLMVVHGQRTGVAGVLEMNTHQTTLDWQEQAFVAFEKGWIRLDLTAPLASFRCGRVTIFRDPGNGAEPVTLEPTLPWIHPMRQQAIHFVAAIRGEATPLCGPDEALADLCVAERYIELFDAAARR